MLGVESQSCEVKVCHNSERAKIKPTKIVKGGCRREAAPEAVGVGVGENIGGELEAGSEGVGRNDDVSLSIPSQHLARLRTMIHTHEKISPTVIIISAISNLVTAPDGSGSNVIAKVVISSGLSVVIESIDTVGVS
jgi:hypothetical protein